MNVSFGYIETRGFIGAVEAADAMLKAAAVHLVRTQKVGSGLITVIVEGELAACQAAVDAGSVAAERVGELVSSLVIPYPYPDTEILTKSIEESRQKAEKPGKPAAVSKKQSASGRAGKSVQTDPLDQIRGMISDNAPEGVSPEQIADRLNLSAKDVRIFLKKLLDSGEIERVQKLYYWIKRK